MNVYLLILSDDGIAEVEADTTAEDFEAGTVESLAVIDVLIASESCLADDAFALFGGGHGALQEIFVPVLATTEKEVEAEEYHRRRGNVGCPWLLPQPVGVDNATHVAQLQQSHGDESDSDEKSYYHNKFI